MAGRAEAADADALARRLGACRGDALVVAHALVARDDAEDVVQEAILRVLATAARGTRVEQPRAYLRAVVRQVAHDQRAAARRQLPVADLSEQEAHRADPQRAAELGELLDAVGALPAGQRQALVGTVLTQHDQRALARALRTTPAGVRQLVRRARSRLRDAVGAWAPWTVGRVSELVAAAAPGGGARGGALALAVAGLVAPAAPALPSPPAPPAPVVRAHGGAPSAPGLRDLAPAPPAAPALAPARPSAR